MNESSLSRCQKRVLRYESLEGRRLLAVLFSENFDPIQTANFPSIIGGRVLGATSPFEFHDGNTLYFNGSPVREATSSPVSVANGSLSFRLRLGNSVSPFEDIDQISEQVVVEYLTPRDNTWKLLREFSHLEKGFANRDVWDQVTIVLPADAASNATQFRWRQKSNSGEQFDQWGIDDVLINGDLNLQVNVGPTIRSIPVERAELTFNEPIDGKSFSLSRVKLLKNEQSIPLPSTAVIQPISSTRFVVAGLADANRAEGSYRLEIDGSGLIKVGGGSVDVFGSIKWFVDLTSPKSIDVVDVSPDPRTGGGKAVDNVDIVFSEFIDPSSLTSSDFSLTRDGGPDLIDSSVVITALSGNSIRVSNLAPFSSQGGRYVFSIDGDYKDLAGNVGTTIQRDEWLANDAPTIAIGPIMVFPEDSGPLPIAAGGLIADADTPILKGGKLTVSLRNPTSNNQLGIFSRPQSINQITLSGKSVRFQNLEIGVFSGGANGAPLTIDLNERASLVAVQSLFRSITYQYIGEIPRANIQDILVSVTDGEGGTSRTDVRQVLHQPVNDAPTLTVSAAPLAYALNGTAIPIASSAVVRDIDTPVFYNGSLNVRLVSGRDGKERLGVSGDYSIANGTLLHKGILIGIVNSDGQNGRSLSLRLNESATLAIVQGLARSITFSTLNSTSNAQRSLELFVHDGRGSGQSAITSLVIKPT